MDHRAVEYLRIARALVDAAVEREGDQSLRDRLNTAAEVLLELETRAACPHESPVRRHAYCRMCGEVLS